jgi:hypothetical protein
MQPLQRFFFPLLVHTLPVHFPSSVAVGQVCRLFKFYRAKLPHAFRVPVDREERQSPGPLFADSACGSRDSAFLPLRGLSLREPRLGAPPSVRFVRAVPEERRGGKF